MGPIYTGPKIAAWEAVAGATGYRVYWRAPGTQEWVDSQRAQTSGTTLDLSSVVPQGSWEICATAIDSVSESGPSNVVPWQYAIIGKPENARVQ
uniref:Fibronectin type-III domain-containing protein n=1 Tax=viral metagenome TaxID=1070528 RepID=A0A6M3L3S4_9ZZZZ